MSHVTTSAVVTTTGVGRLETLPQTQLASNERFRDFLASYVHQKTPAHADDSQEVSTGKPHAIKTAASPSGEKGQTQLQKTNSEMAATTKSHETASSQQHFVSAKQVSVRAQNTVSHSAAQKSVMADHKVQSQKNVGDGQQKTSQANAPKNSDKYSAADRLKAEKTTLMQGEGGDAADDHSTETASPQDNIPVAGSNVSAAEDAAPKDHPSLADTTQSNSETGGIEASPQKETIFSAEKQDIVEVKGSIVSNVTTAAQSVPVFQLDSVSAEKTSTDSAVEASHVAQSENASETADNNEQLSRHDEQQPLLYQKNSNGRTTTHIEMNVGHHEKVHVEIGETIAMEQRIHINTDNPKVYQSLKDDRDTLLASLAQSSVSVTASQSIIPPDIQISLSQPSFLGMSSQDERQGSNNKSGGGARETSSATDTPAPERRFLRGVVDLTV
ncbi:flagellar hook-length control protein FliK [Gluconobacter sphaericus]|uniref:flagellar hook-length control protein FliK n=1 Tax=Gluconobacter sphaericus TaxID=574987 RepID=UPI001B8B85FC|nr:flagellar hook-length control protein FliK [Gluconobacter sphaericus]MBS1096937.1 flagellar hook-length control protein FliK [Gluconobacter sphaericus]